MFLLRSVTKVPFGLMGCLSKEWRYKHAEIFCTILYNDLAIINIGN